MSSLVLAFAAALLVAAGDPPRAVYGPPAPVAIRPRPGNAPCPPPSARAADEIVVCARRDDDAERLPLREERFAEGEVARHAGEPARASTDIPGSCARPGSCEPYKSPETYRRIVAALKGEDAD